MQTPENNSKPSCWKSNLLVDCDYTELLKSQSILYTRLTLAGELACRRGAGAQRAEHRGPRPHQRRPAPSPASAPRSASPAGSTSLVRERAPLFGSRTDSPPLSSRRTAQMLPPPPAHGLPEALARLRAAKQTWNEPNAIGDVSGPWRGKSSPGRVPASLWILNSMITSERFQPSGASDKPTPAEVLPLHPGGTAPCTSPPPSPICADTGQQSPFWGHGRSREAAGSSSEKSSAAAPAPAGGTSGYWFLPGSDSLGRAAVTSCCWRLGSAAPTAPSRRGDGGGAAAAPGTRGSRQGVAEASAQRGIERGKRRDKEPRGRI